MKTSLLFCVSLIALSSCTISEEKCIAGDWAEIGVRDGAIGRSETRIQAYQKTCAKYDVEPDSEKWLGGRKEGLLRYCTAQNLYKIGRNDTTMNQVCEGKDIALLQAANDKGLRYYSVNSEIRSHERERNDVLTELSELSDDESNSAKKTALLSRISHIDFKLRFLFLERLRYDSL